MNIACDYDELLAVCGADVFCFDWFGSYEGQWFAKIGYDGQIFWVSGSYGSCSGCDSLEGCYDDADGQRKLGKELLAGDRLSERGALYEAADSYGDAVKSVKFILDNSTPATTVPDPENPSPTKGGDR